MGVVTAAAPLPSYEPDTLDAHAAAAEAGVHYDTFRKNWRGWALAGHDRYCGFPPPFRCPPPGARGSYAWRRSAIADWKLARERALDAGHATPPSGRATAADAAHAAACHDPHIRRQRAQLARMMESPRP